MEWPVIAQGIFYFLGSAAACWVAWSIERMRASVEELNSKVAMVLERTAGHEKRISRLEDKI